MANSQEPPAKKAKRARFDITDVEYDLFVRVSSTTSDRFKIAKYIYTNTATARPEDMPQELRGRYWLAVYGPKGNPEETWLKSRVRSLADKAR